MASDANKRRRESTARMERNPNGQFVRNPPGPCLCCREMFNPTLRQRVMICGPCLRTNAGQRTLRKHWANKREAKFQAMLAEGTESLPDKDSFSPLLGEAAILKMMRGEW